MADETPLPGEKGSVIQMLTVVFLRLAESLEADAAFALRQASTAPHEAEWTNEIAKRAVVAANELRAAVRLLRVAAAAPKTDVQP